MNKNCENLNDTVGPIRLLVWLEQWLKDYPDDLPRYYLYPSINGKGFRLEWDIGDCDVSLDIPEIFQGVWHELNLRTDIVGIECIILNEDGWHWVYERLRTINSEVEEVSDVSKDRPISSI